MKDLKPRSLPIFLPTDDGIKYCLLFSYSTKIAVSAGMVDSLKSYVKQTNKQTNKNWNIPHSVLLYFKKKHKKD
jgi:hypothetical protein